MADSVHYQCLLAIRNGIIDLSLDGFQPNEIQVRSSPWSSESIYRGITVHDLEEDEAAGTNQREDIGYACAATIIIGNDHAVGEGIDTLAEMRARIRRRFVHQAIASVSLVGGIYLTTTVGKSPMRLPKQWDDTYLLSSLVIRCWMREPRG